MAPDVSTLQIETTNAAHSFAALPAAFENKREQHPADLQQVLLLIAELDRVSRCK